MIVHLSTVHPRHDVRILIKEINSAKAKLTHDVVLVVADAMGDDQINLKDGIIQIFDVGKSRFGRLGRIFVTSFRAFVRVKKLRPKLIHFHDPELLLAGFLFKLLGYKVIYDIHGSAAIMCANTI